MNQPAVGAPSVVSSPSAGPGAPVVYAVTTPPRRGLLRLTPEALAAALRLQPGIRILRMKEEAGWIDHPLDILLLLEDVTGARLPVAPEHSVLRVVAPETVTEVGDPGA